MIRRTKLPPILADGVPQGIADQHEFPFRVTSFAQIQLSVTWADAVCSVEQVLNFPYPPVGEGTLIPNIQAQMRDGFISIMQEDKSKKAYHPTVGASIVLADAPSGAICYTPNSEVQWHFWFVFQPAHYDGIISNLKAGRINELDVMLVLNDVPWKHDDGGLQWISEMYAVDMKYVDVIPFGDVSPPLLH